jgi:hypothetical protein
MRDNRRKLLSSLSPEPCTPLSIRTRPSNCTLQLESIDPLSPLSPSLSCRILSLCHQARSSLPCLSLPSWGPGSSRGGGGLVPGGSGGSIPVRTQISRRRWRPHAGWDRWRHPYGNIRRHRGGVAPAVARRLGSMGGRVFFFLFLFSKNSNFGWPQEADEKYVSFIGGLTEDTYLLSIFFHLLATDES